MRTAASRIGRLVCALVAMSAVTATAFADGGAALLPSGPPLVAPGALVGRHGQLHFDLTAAPGTYTRGAAARLLDSAEETDVIDEPPLHVSRFVEVTLEQRADPCLGSGTLQRPQEGLPLW